MRPEQLSYHIKYSYILSVRSYDPFELQKLQALLKSGSAVAELAAAGEKLLADQAAAGVGAAATKAHLQEVFQVHARLMDMGLGIGTRLVQHRHGPGV
jgi:hypothetical protein